MTPAIRSLLERAAEFISGPFAFSDAEIDRLERDIRDALYAASLTPVVDPHATRVTKGRVCVTQLGPVYQCNVPGWKGGIVVDSGVADGLLLGCQQAYSLIGVQVCGPSREVSDLLNRTIAAATAK